jgi:endonuclease/exonuclease/phosphatase (EEP) superfamily protein YafD
LIRREFKIVAIFAVFEAANLIVLASCLWGAKPLVDSAGNKLRVLLLNVRTENERCDLVIRCIHKYRPDVIVLEEVNERWLKELARLHEDFPHVIEEPRDDNFGIVLFSRLPLNSAKIIYLGGAEVPSVTAQFEVGACRFTVLGTHALPPGTPENFRFRNEQLDQVARFVANQAGPVIVLGDLNATPWSYYFERLVRESRLTDSSKGRGIHPTWPASVFPLRIPIDHCLVSPEIGVIHRMTGNSVGSDHLPLVVDLILPSGDARAK